MPAEILTKLSDILLDERSSYQHICAALDEFTSLCSAVSGIVPDPGFQAWADDTFLKQGLAINPQAAAQCIKDYQRSIVFIRGIYAAISELQKKSDSSPVTILYAGCGPFATLILLLLCKFKPDELNIHLLDIHQKSLDSVHQLIEHFGFKHYSINLLHADACEYQHPTCLDLIIAETMQKSLEQEPQFAVCANLAPQLCMRGIFIPEKIDVQLCLAQAKAERELFEHFGPIDHHRFVQTGKRIPLAHLITLDAERVVSLMEAASYNQDSSKFELKAIDLKIPEVSNLAEYDALILTHIQVFRAYTLRDYESDLTLPLKCQELSVLKAGAEYRVNYQLGDYPRFKLSSLNN